MKFLESQEQRDSRESQVSVIHPWPPRVGSHWRPGYEMYFWAIKEVRDYCEAFFSSPLLKLLQFGFLRRLAFGMNFRPSLDERDSLISVLSP